MVAILHYLKKAISAGSALLLVDRGLLYWSLLIPRSYLPLNGFTLIIAMRLSSFAFLLPTLVYGHGYVQQIWLGDNLVEGGRHSHHILRPRVIC